MRRLLFSAIITVAGLLPVQALEVRAPAAVMCDVPYELTIDFGDRHLSADTTVLFNGVEKAVRVKDGRAKIGHRSSEKETLRITCGAEVGELTVRPIPLWLSIIPPLLAILMALLIREVFTALLSGLFSGILIIQLFSGKALWMAILRSFTALADTYLLRAIADIKEADGALQVNYDHLSIIVFSMLIGGTVSLITRNGGMMGVVNALSRYARGPVSGQLVTWAMGILIFFDDYANTLVVGNTMRPVADRLRISREKLSYIVDSTAAPVAAIALVTTWIGAELSYIQEGLVYTGIRGSAYEVFLHSLKYSYYPLLTLGFMLMLILMRRDFGPMFKAERITRNGGMSAGVKDTLGADTFWEEDKVVPVHWVFALVPIVVIVAGSVAGLVVTGLGVHAWDPQMGFARNLSEVIGASDAYRSLLWSSFLALVISILITILWRLVRLKEIVESILRGFRTMLTAMLILILAWAIAAITKELHTASFIANAMQEISMDPRLLPAMTFVFAAVTAFSTGTSWGTMAILYPLLLGSSWQLSLSTGMDHQEATHLFYGVVSSVLAGAVFGDHCSPISDTTIMSSLASSCDHIEHVRTQLPYALTVGIVSVLCGTVPTSFGLPWYLSLLLGFAVLFVLIRLLGRKVEQGSISD